MSPCTANHSTSPTTAVFSSAFAPFQSAWVPNTRFSPAIGSKWSGCGVDLAEVHPALGDGGGGTATSDDREHRAEGRTHRTHRVGEQGRAWYRARGPR